MASQVEENLANVIELELNNDDDILEEIMEIVINEGKYDIESLDDVDLNTPKEECGIEGLDDENDTQNIHTNDPIQPVQSVQPVQPVESMQQASQLNILNVKKYIIFTCYIASNLFLISTLFLFGDIRYTFLIGALFIFGSHIRDVCGICWQLTHMHQIVRKLPPVPDDKKVTICCLIPTYNEAVHLVKQNIDSLSKQNVSKNTKLFIFVICDGLKIKKPNIKPLYNGLDDIMTYENDTVYEYQYIHWKKNIQKTMYYKFGKYNNIDVVLAYKPINLGKKDSLIVGEHFIENVLNEKYEKIDYIYHTDSDTVADLNCLKHLSESLVNNDNLDGVSGLVKTYCNDDEKITAKLLVLMQEFQYFFSLICRRQTESLLNCTVCLPGCVNMIRVNKKSHGAISKYANLPRKESNFVETVTRMQGTDRRYTTLLIEEGAKLQMNWRAIVYTEPPLTVSSFINQRRRWSSNAFFNAIVLLCLPTSIPIFIRISTFIDICRLYSTIFRFVSYVSFWILLEHFTLWDIISITVFLSFPYLYSFIWMIAITDAWKRMTLGFIINKMLMPFLVLKIITKMYWTSTNFAWAKIIKKKKEKKKVVNHKQENVNAMPVQPVQNIQIQNLHVQNMQIQNISM